MTTYIARGGSQRGISIIEALIALVVMGFGILSLAGMHGAMSRHSDDARNRTEAIRLAQERLEVLRSFTGISATVIGTGVTSTTALNWNNFPASGSDSISTSAAFTRTWTVGGANTDPMRTIAVNVAWTDRAGDAQNVTLSSIISKTDPSDAGFLGFPLPLNTNLKRPKDRNLDIPIRAIDLGNGESALKFGTSGQYVVFGNISGDVVKICTPSLSGSPTDAQVISALTDADAGTNGCEQVNGYIVTGYIARHSSVNNTTWNAVEAQLGISTLEITRHNPGARPISCHVEDAVNQNTQELIPDYKSYLCVIPLAEPSPALTQNGPYYWQGKVKVAGPSSWRGSGSSLFVCQFDYPENSALLNTTSRVYHPTNRSIDQQNFLLASQSNSSTAVCPSAMTVSGVSTGALHQDCRSTNANFTSDCPLTASVTTYTLTYHANGGSGTPPTVASYAPGATVTVAGAGSLSKVNSSFSGWNTAAAGTGTSYAANATFTMSGNVTLYAQWVSGTATTTLGTPVLSWSTTGNPKTITWPAVTGADNATTYQVYECVLDNQQAYTTACTPTTPAGSLSATNRLITPTLSSKDVYCYAVEATGPTGVTPSAKSNTRCVYKPQGNNSTPTYH